MNGEAQRPMSGLGHNSCGITFRVEVRLFNSLAGTARTQANVRQLDVEPGTTVSDLACRLRIPREKIFLVLVNGRDITRGQVGDPVNGSFQIDDGDVVAFSGPVPYSHGYGAPVI
ncbi:MAG: hypothetical protein MI741_02160 [Rhodospirillales bacterium]|nr:hypothetical protein [Rhodospirillales bacterium]